MSMLRTSLVAAKPSKKSISTGMTKIMASVRGSRMIWINSLRIRLIRRLYIVLLRMRTCAVQNTVEIDVDKCIQRVFAHQRAHVRGHQPLGDVVGEKEPGKGAREDGQRQGTQPSLQLA